MSGWYVVHTQPGSELRAEANLRRQGYETYLPRYRRRRSHARRVDFVDRPLFPRYMFVRFDPSADRWRPILGTFGVCGLVRFGDIPVPVPAGIVDALRANEAARTFDDPVSPVRGLGIGAQIRVIAGPFADIVGKFQALADLERVVVLLDLLGREVTVRLPEKAVAVA